MREWGGEKKKGEKREDNAPLEAWGKEARGFAEGRGTQDPGIHSVLGAPSAEVRKRKKKREEIKRVFRWVMEGLTP